MKLPLSCQAAYYEGFLTKEESAALFDWHCTHIDYIETTEIELADGTVHHLDTGKWMFVDPELTSFSLLPEAHGRRMEWPSILPGLKGRIEQLTGVEFSVCVGIYYANGACGVGYHADPPSFGPTDVIASVSLGQAREFRFRNIENHADELSLELEDGSLVIMGQGCQDTYEHALPVNPIYPEPRINLTFRKFDWPVDARPDSRPV
jgi:alkylated DNA repair dioxygenase AlkB